MAYRNRVKYKETTRTRREAKPPVFIHVSKPLEQTLDGFIVANVKGVTYKKPRGMPNDL